MDNFLLFLQKLEFVTLLMTRFNQYDIHRQML